MSTELRSNFGVVPAAAQQNVDDFSKQVCAAFIDVANLTRSSATAEGPRNALC